MPRCLRSGGTLTCGAAMVSPFIRTLPDIGFRNPAIVRSSVVLPEPDGPISTMNSPGRTFRLTSSRPRLPLP